MTAIPSALSLWFSETPELAFTRIELTDSAGHAIALGAPRAVANMGVVATISSPLAAGRYTVRWSTAASDGHKSSGTYAFSIDLTPEAAPVPAAAPPSQSPQAPAAIVDTIRPRSKSNAPLEPSDRPVFSSAMRWAELIALLVIVGLVILRLAVVTQARWDGAMLAEVNDRAVRLGRALIVLFAVASLTRGFAQAELFPTSDGSRVAALAMLVQHSRWGTAWAVGLGGALVALVGFFVAGQALNGWIMAALGVVAMALSESLTGHAGAVKHFAAAVAADVAHVLGAGGWLGGLTALLLCAMPVVKRLDRDAAADAGSRLLRAFHGAASECVAVVVLSAVVAMWVRFPTLASIYTTPYGQMLLRKTFFVAVVAAFGLYHWRRVVIPDWTDDSRLRFQRSAIAELIFGAVVVAFTALLVTQPLP